jgi:hypothetical protein
MLSYKETTMSGYNEYLKTLQKDDVGQNYLFTLTKFNSDKVEVIHDAVAVKDVPELTHETYDPGYTTPLYDAIGRTIKATEEKISKMRGKPAVLMVVLTDGLENASKEYSRDSVFKMISTKEKEGWTFAYLGANQDAYAEGVKIGIPKGNILNYVQGDEVRTSKKLSLATERFAASELRETASFFDGIDEDETPNS